MVTRLRTQHAPAPQRPSWSGDPPSILHALIDACRRAPQKACIVFEGRRYTYADVLRRAAGWAGAMRASGLRPGERVALYLENCPDLLFAYLGAHLAGAIVVPVNVQYRQVELRHIFSDAGVRLCVTDAERVAELQRVAPELPALELVVVVPAKDEGPEAGPRAGGTLGPAADDGPQRRQGDLRLCAGPSFLATASGGAENPGAWPLPRPDDVALIAYTSGTTGRAKGAMLTHGNLAANSVAVTTAWRWTADDVLLLALPLFHIHGLGVGWHGTVVAGSTVELRRRFDAAEVYDTLLQGTVTMFFGVPTMYTRLIAEARRRAERPAPIRLYVSGSAPLSVQTFEEFERLFGQCILERYGMTETIMNLTNPYDGERRPGTVGLPFPGQEARVVDLQTRRPVPDGTVGEIQVRGPHVFKGYWQNPQATAEAFDDEGWFNTGDLGWRSPDGYFTISGRAKELIISGGYNIYPREVEEVLATHPGIAEAAVLGLPDPEYGEQVVAAVVRRPRADVTAEALVDFCRERLASYKKPRRVVFLDALPRNALGKVQKHVLRAQLAAGH
jgi:malonyl-CoA/methylmalonyl-CoA synthetase